MKNKIEYIWTKSHPGFAYFTGYICELPEKTAKKLLKSGHIKKYVAPEPEAPVSDLPEDFPGRDALIEHGLTTLAEARQIKDFTEIKGIGKSTNAMILDFLKKL